MWQRKRIRSLWNDPEFELFDPDSGAALRRLSAALSEEARPADPGETVWFDLTPKAYQAEMPTCALAPAIKVHIEGDRPMSLHWKREVALPIELFRAFSVLRA